MKILVIGGGGREHALVWKIAQSPLVTKIWCAPGNPGIAQLAECVPLAADDISGLLTFAMAEGIDLTVVGPEAPLTLGIVDRFKAEGQLIFGPSQAAARVEGSKAFSKDLMAKYGIPTAAYGNFSDRDAAVAFIRQQGAPIVVKADGLAAGKGVILAQTVDEAIAAVDEIMLDGKFGDAGKTVVIEEFLYGEEASFFAFTDGTRVLPLASAQDHKQIFDGDQGPNTGGMGTYSPAPVVTAEVSRKVVERILQPTVDGLAAEGCPYCGILFIGLMIKDGEPTTLEYNARFGDPECQSLMMRLRSDIVPVLLDCARGELKIAELEWHDRAAVCVVMASGGYPDDYRKGFPIQGLEQAATIDNLTVFHAGTAAKDGKIVNVGGRVLGVTATGDTVAEAIATAYRGVKVISWEGAQYRTDIGRKALNR